MELTEKDAAIAYAKAWNALDCSDFLELLADDCTYESQWVTSALEGKEAISKYLTGKMKTVKTGGGATVRAEHALTTVPAFLREEGRDCVVLTQCIEKEVQVAILFEVADGKI
ncbi:hypothetical protein UWK_03614 (plasmid) [Desulfocapsa sulfexigens DSM 10523]|uniref:SnoaL-like domain-containing protein n=1 Tax=Desulfocapsa sulfexigens (strain DSM 10523 / SB164P1) TaxID=1167006 RepID=M1P9J2_DESSD|nr:nuclear transport factor 2 family protein [Desulfocapsa sulfexigens]AGF80123.1 hypothetical protein UWK_03614 [Desulfocapsa sulfexigens DSM 10523]